MLSIKQWVIVFIGALLALSMGTNLNAQQIETYVVQPGDTLEKIAENFYSDKKLAPKLWEANKSIVAHHNKLTVGDTLFIFPKETYQNIEIPKEKIVIKKAPPTIPPPPLRQAKNLYDKGTLYDLGLPKYITFLADGRGIGGSGASRIKVKRQDSVTKEVIDELYETRFVGEIIASAERSPTSDYSGIATSADNWPGKTLLTTGDTVMIRFTEDMGKILDSDTYEDYDPYFREYAIFGLGPDVIELGKDRSDKGANIGNIYRYKGIISVIARVESIAPTKKIPSKSSNNDVEPVTYISKIIYSEEAIKFGDKIFIFIPLSKGPERTLSPAYVEPADSYRSSGH